MTGGKPAALVSAFLWNKRTGGFDQHQMMAVGIDQVLWAGWITAGERIISKMRLACGHVVSRKIEFSGAPIGSVAKQFHMGRGLPGQPVP